ncbi:MAG TPA: putative metal-dependent hydrolase [Bacteroidota bacterium]|nr:putative metal-dependent hydrolase [Bacteroidota bacterium]
MTREERNESIEKIKTLPAKLEAAVKGLNDQQLNSPYGEGKWSLRQVAHHIADANMNAYTRMKLVATEQKPILKPYNQNQWAVQEDSVHGSVESSIQILRGLHERWVRFLNNVPEESWLREGIHLENGKVTLESILALYAKHAENHVQQIVTFRQKMGW